MFQNSSESIDIVLKTLGSVVNFICLAFNESFN